MSIKTDNKYDQNVGKKNTRSTKYLLTINNPNEHGLDRETLIRKCEELGATYYAISDEIGLNEKTPHSHLYIVFRNARSFNTLKNCFESAHIEKSYGTHSENIDYVFKEGKWLDDSKGETNLRDSHYESGQRPENNQGRRTDLAAVKQMIDEGYEAEDIVEQFPSLLLRQDAIERLVERRKDKLYKNLERPVKVYYVWGPTGSGKSHWVFHKFGYSNVYRADDGKNPFDNYDGEDVLFLDEYHSDYHMGMFLKITDKYPVRLARRWFNKMVRYTKVFVVSNVPIGQQYSDVAERDPETYKAFIRRFDKFIYFGSRADEDRIVYNDYNDYLLGMGCSLEEYEAKELKESEAEKEQEENHKEAESYEQIKLEG